MKNRLSTLVLLLTSVTLLAQKTIKRTIYFENANAQLSIESQNYLRSLADTVKKYPKYSIALKGHTDATGTASENQAFSQKRALVIKSELVKHGVDAQSVIAQSVGATEPIGDNNTEGGKKLNRRVDMAITILPVAAVKKYQNMKEFYRDLSVGYQNFKINTAKDTIIRGEKGTILFIPKAAFEGVAVNAIVDFRLKEAYSVSDIISENLSTMSGDKLLQTGGMIYIDAKYNGKDLTLEKTMNVAFSSKESNQVGMQLFSGVRDSKNNGSIDWIPLNKDGEVEEVTLYKHSGGYEPSLITDKDGYIVFKELIDTTGCHELFLNRKTADDLKSVNMNILNKVQMAMVFTARQNPIVLKGTIENIHYSTFKETYELYNVVTFSQLVLQNGIAWDSLMVEKMAFIEKVSISEEEMKRREMRQKFVQDSLKKEYTIWYEANKERLEKEKKDAQNFNRVFPLKNLYWANCDAYAPSDMINMQFEAPQSQSYSVVFILKNAKISIQAYNKDNNLLFLNAPKNEMGTLVGMKILDGQPYLSISNIRSANQVYKFDFKPYTTEEIKEQLKGLNK